MCLPELLAYLAPGSGVATVMLGQFRAWAGRSWKVVLLAKAGKFYKEKESHLWRAGWGPGQQGRPPGQPLRGEQRKGVFCSSLYLDPLSLLVALSVLFQRLRPC